MEIKKHYRAVPMPSLCKHLDELVSGYLRGADIEEFSTYEAIPDPHDFFRSRKYCVEAYEHRRSTCGDSKAFCIGWAIGREDRMKMEAEE